MLFFPQLQSFSDRLRHGVTQADEGDFNDEHSEFESNLCDFVQKNRLPTTPRYLKQIHGKTVSVETLQCNVSTDTSAKQGDALITNQLHIPLMVKTADCQGIIIYSPDVHALGVVHSGWRGSVQNIIGHTIEEMVKQYKVDPAQMHVSIGPSLGPCCAEFTDPKKELPSFFHPFIQGQKVNLWQLSVSQCQNAGVPLNHIQLTPHCTRCQPGYFSHRRGDRERFITWGMLK